jgi:tight adherence protein C
MILSALSSYLESVTPLKLLGEFAIVFSGIIFVLAGLQSGREAIGRRADLVLPQTRTPPVAIRASRPVKALPRLPQISTTNSQDRFIILGLSKLGVPPERALSLFAVGRLIAAIGLGMAATVAIRHTPSLATSALIGPVIAVAAAIVGWLLPVVVARVGARKRARQIANELPQALDLIVVCLDAGLSLEDALTRVVNELGRSETTLTEELALLSADLQILPNRDEALQKMAARVDIPSVQTFVITLTQTLRYGTPLAQALRTIANELRNDALTQLEERANQLPALLTVPLMLFIMPTIFLIIGGPAVLKLIDVWGR